jgi:gliding motility-associated-like protein
MKSKMKNVKLVLLSTLMIFLGCQFSTAQDWKADYKKSRSFIENKGQFDHFENEKTGKIEYAIDFGATKIFFSKKGVTYQFIELNRLPKAERRELKKEATTASTLEEYKALEKEMRKYDIKSDVVNMLYQNSSSKTKVVAEGKMADYHSYSFFDKKKNKQVHLNYINGFEKLVYKNIYPNIDIEYVVHPIIGVKYAIIVHPGANPSDVQMTYDKMPSLSNGQVQIPTLFGNVVDHAPLTFYEDNKSAEIDSKFSQQGNTIRFELAQYDNTKTLVIDPWTQTPAFNTNWDCVWELDTDAAGNVYIIGGVMPLQLLKYNNTGVLQWTHNTPYDTTEWLGTMATDDVGNTYVTNGTDYRIQKVNTSGGVVWNNLNPSGGNLSTEFWNISFNCDQTKLLVGGSGGALDIHGRIYDINMNTGNVNSSVQVTAAGNLAGIPPQIQEVRAMTAAPNGKYYFVTLDTIGFISDNISLCGTSPSSITRDNHGIAWGYKSENFRYSNTGIKVIRADENFVYVNRGNRLQKRSLQDFSLISDVAIPGGNLASVFLGGNQSHNAGIDIDDCGNIYVGSTNGVYKFSSALVQLASFPTTFNVYDVRVSTNGDVIACGGTGNSGSGTRSGAVQSFAAAACAQLNIVCCNTTVCNPGTLCANDPAVTLTVATPGGTWSGNGVNASGSFNPAIAGAGVHTITYTLACGSETINITVSPCQALEVCQETNGTLTVSNGVGPYTWEETTTTTTTVTNQAQCTACGGQWLFISCTVPSCSTTGYSQFATGANATPTANFPIRITDSEGTEFIINSLAGIPACSAVPCPTITLTPSGVTNVSCATSTNGAATVTASGGTAPYTYSWSPGGLTGGTQSALAPGTYTITATDAASCTGTTTVTITAPTALTASTTSTAASCGASNGTATATPAGGTAPYSYAWSPSGGSGATASNLGAGSYTVTVTDASGCQATSTVSVTASGGPTLSTSGVTNVTCFGGTNGTATINAVGGTAPYTYSWSPGGLTGATQSALTAGTYTVTVTDASSCSATTTVTITQPTQLTFTSSTTPASCGVNDGSGSVVVSGGTGAYTYSWSPTGGSGASASGLSSGPYVVTITDAAGCQLTANVNVPSNGGPTLAITASTNPSCAGVSNGSATVTATGGTAPLTYAWSPTGGSAATATGLPAGIYTVTVTDGAGCIVAETVTLTNPAGITLTGTVQASNCATPTGQIAVTATGGTAPLTFAWSPTGGSAATATGLAGGDYTITVTDANGCTATDDFTVGVTGGIPVNVSPTLTTITQGDSVQLIASGAVTYTWTPTTGLSCTDCSNPYAAPAVTTTYMVTGTDANGCSGDAEVTVVINPICGDVFVPTIFSPNFDNNNEKLCVYGNCIVELNFAVYNRWGERVFQTEDIKECWDGRYKEKPVNSGTFVYKLIAKLIDGTTVEMSGNVSVVR